MMRARRYDWTDEAAMYQRKRERTTSNNKQGSHKKKNAPWNEEATKAVGKSVL